MTTSERDPILDAFDRHLSAVERLIPANPPALVGQAERKPIRVVAGTTIRRGQRPGSGRRLNLVLAPIGVAAVVIAALVGVGLMTRPVATLIQTVLESMRVVPRVLLSTGMAPVTATLLDVQMRRSATPAMARVARRLGIDADWVLFGHVHRRGPISRGVADAVPR